MRNCGKIIIIACLLCFAAFAALAEGMEEVAEETPTPKYICLTFDDGPSVYTKSILNILEENNVRATFCVLGERVKQYQAEIERALALGCEVIGHSWDHTMLPNLTNEQIEKQITRTYEAIESVIGKPPLMIYRAPGGTTSPRLLKLSEELGFMLLHWTAGSNDYALLDAKKIHDAVYYNTRSGSIMLCHDLYGATVKAMRTVIPKLLSEGYKFVTISEYMEIYGDEIVPGMIYRGHEER
ncbi:MAG: polysaccharide deacetylase family protein [Oscillospiraceae bacterium]|nr:polysaccharide deacetylase family protein [Oscillospiraceae bacterium]